MFDLSSVESQGDEADCMYFIEDGEVRVTVKNQVNFCDPKTPPPPPKKIETFSNFISISIIFYCTKFLFQFDYLIFLLSLSVFFFSASVSISLQYLYKQLRCLCFQDLLLFLIAT